MEKNVLEQQRSSSVYEWCCREHCGRQSAPGMQLRMLLRNSELASESYPTRKYCPGRQVRCQGAMRIFSSTTNCEHRDLLERTIRFVWRQLPRTRCAPAFPAGGPL